MGLVRRSAVLLLMPAVVALLSPGCAILGAADRVVDTTFNTVTGTAHKVLKGLEPRAKSVQRQRDTYEDVYRQYKVQRNFNK